MKKSKILADITNILVTVFLIILIPMTIIGTSAIVANVDNIRQNTKFRIEIQITIDSLRQQLRLEKYINDVQRTHIKEEILE